ncbi:major histocompatibility complex class I-related gene protein [Xenopus laevis]|uniref:Major histocompatibility complex class I-related gene protein n=2 Tax=Xenopus laevis TaxID=8355 RepID=A0A1L8H432_XENLA|nr:major histocompatibility complex class I-related gene protein [Xenopus laevis]OCT90771.1 hypothetical protein XELAEV_18019388mg [Xenopus laevis]
MFGLILLCVCLLVPSVCPASHTLQYAFTLISDSARASYFIVAFVNDAQIGRYSSDTQQVEPLLDWMKKGIKREHWETMTSWGKHYQNCHTKDMGFFKDRFNRTYGDRGPFIYQVTFACEVEEDGSVRGHEAFAYNGNEFMFFDKDKMQFVAVRREAEVVAQVWNGQQFSAIKHKKHMEQDCVEWMKLYLTYGKGHLEKKVRPKVKVFPLESGDSETKLCCWVFGFYPRDVDVRWVRNGTQLDSEEQKEILPNPDGTYQVRLTVTAQPAELDTYFCHVDHSSVNDTQIYSLPEPGKRSHALIAIIACVAVTVIIAGVIIVHKCRTKEENTEVK